MNPEEPHSELKVIVFDMDGVLVDVKSSWQFVHKEFGKNNLQNLKRYKSGEITYRELMRSDIALWGHVRLSRIKSILNKVPIMPGARQTCQCLRTSGLKMALISAGISILAERLQAILGLDYVFANEILADQQGFLTGEGIEKVNLLDKIKVLNRFSIAENFSLAECAVVGDSSYDIPMFKKAGLSIAFNSSEKSAQKSADRVIHKKDLREILPHIVPISQNRSCRI
jgi:phosphoserine phosphatase